jgi:hypothetical protein
MSFLKSLFGAGKSAGTPDTPEARVTGEVEYKGYLIRAVPFKEQGQFQLAGTIEKTVDGVTRTYRFVRADRSAGTEEVTEMALQKGQKIVDEQGDLIFG